jgi:hypothetical protein
LAYDNEKARYSIESDQIMDYDDFDEFENENDDSSEEDGGEFEIEDQPTGDEPTEEELAAAEAKFDVTVKEKMKILLSTKSGTGKRVKAARWLGECGRPQSIWALSMVYKKEKDPKVRLAVEYALGQYKALDETLKRDEEEDFLTALRAGTNKELYKQLNDIVLHSKFGKRKRLRPRIMMDVIVLLFILLTVLIALNVVLTIQNMEEYRVPTEEELFETQTAGLSPEQKQVLNSLRIITDQAELTTETTKDLLDQFGNSLAGQPFICDVPLFAPGPYTVPPEVGTRYPEMATISQRINEQAVILLEVINFHADTCLTETQRLGSDDARETLSKLTTLQDEMAVINEAIDIIDQSLAFDSDTNTMPAELAVTLAAPTDTPTPPLVEPTATVESEIISQHLWSLAGIIDDVSGERGTLPLLMQYWNDVQVNGATGGCDVIPTIPEDHVLEGDLAQTLPALSDASIETNMGLLLLRYSWTMFEEGCQNNTLVEAVGNGLRYTQDASAYFDAAEATLCTNFGERVPMPCD